MVKIEILILLSSVCLSFHINGNSQLSYNNNTQQIEYEMIQNYVSINKLSLFEKAVEWSHINDMAIIYIDSINNDKVIFEKIFELKYTDKGLLSTIGSKEYGIQYSMIIDFKDEKIRCRITNINFLEYKNPKATGINWGYGITTTNIREGEINAFDAENFYPIEINEKKYQEMYTYFFENINVEISKTISYLSKYLTDSNDDW